MNKFLNIAVVTFFVSSLALGHSYSGAPTYTTWSNGQALTSSALNNTLAHCHNTFSGNIDDTMIATTAAINHAKLAVPALIPKAVAYVAASCTTATCTLAASSRVSSIARTGTGVYTVTLNYTPTDANFIVQLTAAQAAFRLCHVTAQATAAPHITFTCRDDAAVVQDTGFNLSVWDDN